MGKENHKMQNKEPEKGITVKIFGSEYNIRATQDQRYIKGLAKYVDDKMQEIASGGIVSSTKVAVLAALNIADELKTLKKDGKLPVDAEEQPVPVVLEYIPYRKTDFTAFRDSIRHPYFAGHGYASVRVDMRGSGDSDGILYDEYLPQEQDAGGGEEDRLDSHAP